MTVGGKQLSELGHVIFNILKIAKCENCPHDNKQL